MTQILTTTTTKEYRTPTSGWVHQRGMSMVFNGIEV